MSSLISPCNASRAEKAAFLSLRLLSRVIRHTASSFLFTESYYMSAVLRFSTAIAAAYYDAPPSLVDVITPISFAQSRHTMR